MRVFCFLTLSLASRLQWKHPAFEREKMNRAMRQCGIKDVYGVSWHTTRCCWFATTFNEEGRRVSVHVHPTCSNYANSHNYQGKIARSHQDAVEYVITSLFESQQENYAIEWFRNFFADENDITARFKHLLKIVFPANELSHLSMIKVASKSTFKTLPRDVLERINKDLVDPAVLSKISFLRHVLQRLGQIPDSARSFLQSLSIGSEADFCIELSKLMNQQ